MNLDADQSAIRMKIFQTKTRLTLKTINDVLLHENNNEVDCNNDKAEN